MLRDAPCAGAMNNDWGKQLMKTTTILAIALGLGSLAACNRSVLRNRPPTIMKRTSTTPADTMEANVDNAADNMTASTDNAADQMKDSAENKADAMKDAADNKADAMADNKH